MRGSWTARVAAAVAGLVVAVTGCSEASGDVPASAPDDVLEVTLQSDASTSTVAPICVEDVPEDLSTCPGAPENLGEVELDETRKATLQLPTTVSEGGYRVRVNGSPLRGMDGVLNDKAQPFQVPPDVVAAPGGTVVTVEALMSAAHPIAVWQFLLSDPPGPPA